MSVMWNAIFWRKSCKKPFLDCFAKLSWNFPGIRFTQNAGYCHSTTGLAPCGPAETLRGRSRPEATKNGLRADFRLFWVFPWNQRSICWQGSQIRRFLKILHVMNCVFYTDQLFWIFQFPLFMKFSCRHEKNGNVGNRFLHRLRAFPEGYEASLCPKSRPEGRK